MPGYAISLPSEGKVSGIWSETEYHWNFRDRVTCEGHIRRPYNKQHCSAEFVDITQAFDKIWHTGHMYKLRRSLPLNYFLILKSYLHSRHFFVNVETQDIELSSINTGVRQFSVLGPLLYLLYTSDLPTSPHSTTAFDDTAILDTGQWSSHCFTEITNRLTCNPRLV
jgi:hypothetical protein